MNPFPTRQHAENYVARLPADQRPAMRARLGLDDGQQPQESAPSVNQPAPAQIPVQLPPPRAIALQAEGPAQPPPRPHALHATGHRPHAYQACAPGTLTFSLPYPPSVNAIWRAAVIMRAGKPTARVLLSTEGRDYRRAVQNVIRSLGSPSTPPGARLALTLTAHMPDRRARDLSNLPKALEDALTHAEVWADDSLIDELRVLRGDVVSGGRVDVEITPVTDTLFAGQL